MEWKVVKLAVLNKCSQGNFVVEGTVKELDIKGIKTSVHVKKIIDWSRLNSKIINDWIVSNPVDAASWISFPQCYTKQDQ